ncbi:SPFH domain / Band 7 family protein [Planctomycetes bacterium Poly30]|uniref:SPFH domain / Band 7 family protein n=1 Tax=Saltatorellus ferox TaxID=2528018 RepID=A0A518EKS5_9BACT|nr:SPFH domain / Band 7 family protein [Planctomycetes bacterium Poly30]
MSDRPVSQEKSLDPLGGWPMLGMQALLFLGVIALFALGGGQLDHGDRAVGATFMISAVLMLVISLFHLNGFFIVDPNQARVLVLFGRYRGTVRQDGFFWTNPFTSKRKLSLRAHNLDGSKLKVNDLLGNPIEISAVVVWRVQDTARASFDVEDYEEYVHVQSEAALRHMATKYPYDDLQAEGAEITLRGSTDEVAEELEKELTGRLKEAGIEVIEARLNHLAYAQEIASAMLQRQQAGAIIAARALIVEGAVSMVEDALDQLARKNVVTLDEDRKAMLVGNLLVVLCGQESVKPMLNTGPGGM